MALEYKQIADFVNETTKEILGEDNTLQIREDLSDVTEFAKELQNLDIENKFLSGFANRILKSIVYSRAYQSPENLGIMKDYETYGAIRQRMYVDEMPEASEAEWSELQDGVSVDPFEVHLPKAQAQYSCKPTVWDLDMTILEKQYRKAFTSAGQLAAFVSAIFQSVENSKTIKNASLEKALLRNVMGEVIHEKFGGNYNQSTVQAVNLLYEYNQETGSALTRNAALRDPDFLKFAAQKINEYTRAMKLMDVQYNLQGKPRFTSEDHQRLIVLGRFADAMQYNLQADTYHNELVKLKGYGTVDCWQKSNGRTFDTLSSLKVKTSENNEIDVDGVVGVLYDDEAMAITDSEVSANSIFNPKGLYTNYFWHADYESVAYKDMNFVVFIIK